MDDEEAASYLPEATQALERAIDHFHDGIKGMAFEAALQTAQAAALCEIARQLKRIADAG